MPFENLQPIVTNASYPNDPRKPSAEGSLNFLKWQIVFGRSSWQFLTQLFPAGRDDDGVQDDVDNCNRISNPDQLDTDGDKIGISSEKFVIKAFSLSCA